MSVPADVRAYVTANDLTTRSSWRATGRTAVVVALYATATGVGFALDRPLAWLAVAASQAFVLLGSYSAMHEAAHGLLYRHRSANRLAGLFWAATILVNFSMWRSFHLEHHANTSTADDPENRYKVAIVRRSQYLLLPLGGLQFLVYLYAESLGIILGRFPAYVRLGANRRAMRVDAGVLLGATAGLVTALVVAPALVLHVWGGAFLIVACLLLPLTAINEHYGCDSDGDAFDTTRTVVSNRLFRFLVWNSNFHMGHHLLASVPFHAAPQLHDYLEPRTRYLARSYTSFHLDVLRSCRTSRSTEPEKVSSQVP